MTSSSEKPQPQPLSRQEVLSKMPNAEIVQRELASAKSLDDFFGKEGIFARLFASTLEQLLEVEMTQHLGYEPYAVEGRNTGNSRNGKRPRQIRTSAGDLTINVPRDRKSEFDPAILSARQTSTNELETKIIYLYGKGVSTRDIQQTLNEIYGVDVSPATISAITDKVKALAEASVAPTGAAESRAGFNLPDRLPGCHSHQAASRRPRRKYCGLQCAGS